MMLLFGALASNASAATVDSGTCGDNVYWSLDDAGTLTIYGSGPMWDQDDPSATGWYSYKNSVRKVVVNSGVTSIGGTIFSGYGNLTSVSIPNTVTSIGYASFEVSGLTGVVIPDSVTSIDDGAFYKCESLQRVTIGCGVSNIPWVCFHGCSALKTIIFRGDAPNFNSAAFGYVTATAYYPANNTTWADVATWDYGGNNANITSMPYYQCGDNVIAVLNNAGTLTISGSGDMYDYTSGAHTPWSSWSYQISKVVIQAGVTNIAEYAFSECNNLTSAVIPGSVVSIENWSFWGCSNLASIEIPNGVTNIGESAFDRCSSLTSITIPDSVTSIGEFAFNECNSLEDVTIGNGVTRIRTYTFQSCKSLKNVKIGSNVTSIEDAAFGDCTSLMSVEIPNSVINIGFCAFNNCTSLTSVTIGKGVQIIDGGAFQSCSSLTSITIPSSVMSITDYAFNDCANLRKIDFEGNVPEIASTAFYGVTATVYYPANNATWTADKLQNYGGNLAWIGYKTDLDEPTITASNDAATGKPKISWSKVDGAAKYELYWAASKTGSYTKIATVTSTSVTNSSAKTGKQYYYKVKAVAADGTKSAYSNIVNRTCDMPRPVVTASNVASSGKVKLSWSAIDGAIKYELYRATSKTGSYSLIGSTTGTSITNTSGVAGKSYYYKVKAIHSTAAANSDYSAAVNRSCDLPQPVVKATNVASTGKIKLSWSAIEGAAKYELYWAASKNGTYTKIATTTGTSVTNNSAKAGKQYYYKVRALHGTNTGAHSAYSAIVTRSCDLPQPVVTATNVASTGKVKLSWSAIEGAEKYELYRATSKTGTYSKIGSTTGTSITNTSGVGGKTYYYKVKALHGSNAGAHSAYSEIVTRTCDLARPTVSVTNVASTGKVKLSWKAIEGATKYEVYRATSKTGTYSKISTTSNTSVTNTSAVAGKTYYYKVRAICDNSAATSVYSAIVNRTCDLAQPTVSATNVASTGKVKLSWKAVEGASSYELYWAASENGTYTKIATTTNTAVVNSSGKGGKTYYYKVRALHSNSAANSAYSAIVKRTCDLAQPKITEITLKDGKPKITWEEVSGAVKYEVYRSTSKTGTYEYVATCSAPVMPKDGTAQAGVTYYYKVRAIHSNSGANSVFSEIKSIKSK